MAWFQTSAGFMPRFPSGCAAIQLVGIMQQILQTLFSFLGMTHRVCCTKELTLYLFLAGRPVSTAACTASASRATISQSMGCLPLRDQESSEVQAQQLQRLQLQPARQHLVL